MSATASIPASAIVAVTPGVIGAGGTALDLSGLVLTTSTRTPIGTVPSFPSALAVAALFGPASHEKAIADVYFRGFDDSNKKPGALLFAQYPTANVGAYLRSGKVSGLSLAQLQALSGVLTISLDGTPVTSGTINLSGATSFSAAAQAITTALATTGPTQASVTGAIGASFTGASIATALTTTGVTGIISVGDVIAGAGVTVGTKIIAQVSGAPGGNGLYTTDNSNGVSSEAMTATSTVLSISAVSSGTLVVGQQITGSGVTADTFITALGTGTGGTGTYTITPAQRVASEVLTVVMPTVSYDSITGSFVAISGTTGAGSTIGFATGTLATPLLMTSATGAVQSQGSVAATPGPFMDAVVGQTQNWAAFMTGFNPDNSGNANKLLFAAWTSAQVDRYVYVMWDTDAAPTTSNNATASAGNLIKAAGYDGTIAVWEPSDLYHAPFALSIAASLDFGETNGRATFAFRRQAGLTAGVTVQTVGDNLIANGYNFYGAYATANDRFVFFYPGSISGEFLWADSYVDQIWLNNSFQLALMSLLVAVKSIPYNQAGYAMIRAACLDPINAGLNFGAIRAGVTLSEAQKAEVNAAAGIKIDDVITNRGWYLQVKDASPIVRAARGSPECSFWYADGQSVQRIELASIEVV